MNVATTLSTLPFTSASFITMVVSTGAAPSVGAVDAHDNRLPDASRMPPALVARETVNVPTAVLAAPAPSLRLRVAVEPETATDARVPAEGTLASAQGVVPAV